MNKSLGFIIKTLEKFITKFNITNIFAFNEDNLEKISEKIEYISLDLLNKKLNTDINFFIINNLPVYTLIKSFDFENTDFLITTLNNNLSIGVMSFLKKNNINILDINTDFIIIYKTKNHFLLNYLKKFKKLEAFSNLQKEEIKFKKYSLDKQNTKELFRYDEILSKIADYIIFNKYKVVSVDFFDTLIYRFLNEPHCLFSSLYKKLLDNKLIEDNFNKYEFLFLRLSAEQMARKKAKKKSIYEINLDYIYEEMKNIISDIEKAKKIEIETEIELSVMNPFVYSLIQYLNSKNIKIIITSDMYLSSNNLRDILKANNFNLELLEQIFISSEHNCFKANKGLFYKILNEMNLELNEIAHIGDNTMSDYEIPLSLGIKSYLYKESDYVINLRKRECFLDNNKIIEFSNYSTRKMLSNVKISNNQIENSFFNLGTSVISPILSSYIFWVLEQAKKYNIKTLLVLMREGELFYEMLYKSIKSLDYDIEIKIFYTSRLSLLIPSIDENIDQKEIFDFLYTYLYKKSNFETVYNLFKILELDTSNMDKNFLDKKIELNDLFSFCEIFTQEKLKKNFKDVIKNKSNIIFEYLKETLGDNINSFAFVDIGYSGTQQTILTKILNLYTPKIKRYGFYLSNSPNSLINCLNTNDIYKSYFSEQFFSNNILTSYSKNLILFEKFICSVIGTNVDYESNFWGTEFLLSKIEKVDYNEFIFISAIKKGILFYHDFYTKIKKTKLSKNFNIFNTENKDIIEYNSLILSRFHSMPLKEEVEIIDKLHHFNHIINKSLKLTGDEQILYDHKKNGADVLIREKHNYWKQAIIQKNDPDKMDKLMYDFLLSRFV
ncbi:MAG: HAD-IA family hydrolase [Cyanobacteriota bacterium]